MPGKTTHSKKVTKEKNLGIIFEYTALGTPQQNGVAEWAFATLMGRARATIKRPIVDRGGIYGDEDRKCFGLRSECKTSIQNVL
jgi:hypothetical protein